MTSKRDAFVAQVTEWARIEGELVNANVELGESAFSLLPRCLMIQLVTEAKGKLISALELRLRDSETSHIILKTKHETLQAAHATLDQSNMALIANIANAKLNSSKAWEKFGLSLPSLLPQLC